MELQIQDLVSSIKKEGIEEAQKQAAQIIAEANAKAESIVNNAKAEATAVLDKANKEIEVLRESAAVSAKQALRDAGISFEREVKSIFERILSSDIKKQVSDEVLAGLIKAAIAGENPSSYTAEIQDLTDTLKKQLADEIRNGLEIKAVKNVGSGFKLASKDGSCYFDVSEEEIVSMLSHFMGDINL